MAVEIGWEKLASVVTIAAPVGVTISPASCALPGGATTGAFAIASRAAATGDSAGSMPCSRLMTPDPEGTGDE